MAFKVWLSLCLVLFAHNLVSLINERYSVNYKIVEENDTLFLDDDENYLVCTPFWSIKEEDSLTFNPVIEHVSVKSFLNYSIASIENRLDVTNLFKLNESFIFNKHVCFTTNKSDLESEGKPFNDFLQIYAIVKIFIYSKGKQPYFYEMAYYRDNSLPSVYFVAYKQKVFTKNYLLNLDCLKRENRIKYNRGGCLSNCLAKSGVETVFYSIDDSKLFNLNQIGGDREFTQKIESYESLRENYRFCLKTCKELDCFWEVVQTVKIDVFYYEEFLLQEGKEKVCLLSNIYSAYYSTDDYYLQLFGLLGLFTGTSIVRLLPALLLLLVKKLKRHHSSYYKFFRIFRLIYPKIRFTICFLSFVFVLNQSLLMVKEFEFNSEFPNKTSSISFINDSFSLVVCFPIAHAFYKDGEISKKRNSRLLKKYDLKYIEFRTTLAFSRNFRLKITYGDSQIETNYTVSDDTLFKSSIFEDQTCLSRCFRIDFELKEIRYKTMMPLANLNFYLNMNYKELFLIDKSQNFESGLVNFRGVFANQKVTKKFSKKSKKSDCRDYSKEERDCNSKKNCLDRCIAIKFIEKYGSLPTYTVVNLTNLPSFLLGSNTRFDEFTDSSIEQKCSSQFKQRDCNEIYFEEGPEMVSSQFKPLNIALRLNYRNNVEIEMGYSFYKTLLDIVSLAPIFFGLNITGTLATILFVITQAFRLKFHKTYNWIVFLVAVIGFLAHNYLVFKSIVKADLNQYQFFKKPDQYILPSPVFCFPFLENVKDKMDQDHQITGQSLDSLTGIKRSEMCSVTSFITIEQTDYYLIL